MTYYKALWSCYSRHINKKLLINASNRHGATLFTSVSKYLTLSSIHLLICVCGFYFFPQVTKLSSCCNNYDSCHLGANKWPTSATHNSKSESQSQDWPYNVYKVNIPFSALMVNESLELMDKFRFILLLVLYHKKVAMCSYMESGWCHTWRACMSVTDENVIQHEASGGSISAAHYSKYLGWIICRGWISLCVVMCTVIHCNDRLFCLKSSLLLKFLTLHQIPTAELSIYPWTFLLT